MVTASIEHIIFLVISIAFLVGTCFAVSKMSKKWQNVMFVIAVVIVLIVLIPAIVVLIAGSGGIPCIFIGSRGFVFCFGGCAAGNQRQHRKKHQ